jgi:diketogulonate reductase-like aldo/keto reductase
LSFREPEYSGLIHHAKDHDYFMIAWRPLKLVKRNTLSPLVPHNVWEKGVFPILDHISSRYGVTNVQMALAWVTHHDHVVTLVKSSRLDHLLEAAEGVSIPLSDEDYKILSQEFSPQFNVSDTISLI